MRNEALENWYLNEISANVENKSEHQSFESLGRSLMHGLVIFGAKTR